MQIYRILPYILFLALIPCYAVQAQERPLRDSTLTSHDSLVLQRDSVVTIQDSLKYTAIEKYSRRSKFTRFLHSIFFRPVRKPVIELPEQNIKPVRPYPKVQGKIIRHIKIDVLDPFGYSIHDTSRAPGKFPPKAGNKLHVKTQEIIIQNLLLFKKHDPYDSLYVNESERLIRSQKYIHDVRFYTLNATSKSDSVDIYIRVRDLWSIVPAFSMSGSRLELNLVDNNFAGLGSIFDIDFHRYRRLNNHITRLSYTVPNIRNSYITGKIQFLVSDNMGLLDSMDYSNSFYSPISSNPEYGFKENRNLLRSIEFSRSFYSPVTKWAGGLFMGQMVTALSYISNDTLRRLPAKTNIQDLWGARSWMIADGRSTDGSITNLIFSLRMLRTAYPELEKKIGPADFFKKEFIYFAGIGVTSRKYIQDRYIFNYGKIEDVPAGKSFGLTVGFDDTNSSDRWYFGLKASWGDYHPSGYLSTHLEYGTLKGPSGFQQGVFTGHINYFTNLLTIGDWKVRQFVRPAFTFGINRLPTDNLTLNTYIEGFEKLRVPARHMFVLSLQTQSYAPWNLIGFRFGPYFFTSMAMLGDEQTGFRKSRLYSLFGLGLLIRNDYLLFNNFQFSFTFYPFIPERGYNIFKSNIYHTTDYGIPGFEISRPEVVEYR